ncbi:MAG: hypothetical protein JJV94_06805 [Sulfurospirillum sp.]|nr:hypothetical protein [Sulfurospirillum sp.]
MKKCDIDCCDECEREVHVDNKCILHCKKNDYQKDKHSSLLSKFYNAFLDYVVKETPKYIKLTGINFYAKAYLKSRKFDNEMYNMELKKNILNLNHIHFPARDGRDTFDYLKILNLFGVIDFNYCEFYLSDLELKDVKCFFEDCKFHKNWALYDYSLLDNQDNVIYQACIFKGKVSSYIPDNKELVTYRYSQFDYTCRFENSIEFDRVKFEEMLFNTNQNNYLEEKNCIKLLKFENCTFEKKFKLNNFALNEFKCTESIFKKKFEFKENKVDNFSIFDTNFENISDFHGSKFKKFRIEKSIFNDFAGFENCVFGATNNKKKGKIATFKYATFKDILNLRDTKFLSGLNIDYINLQKGANFLNTKIDPANTNRETFRLIKYHFDSIGNIIEANKYYQKEMEKREEELKEEKNYFEWIIFKLHDISSKHSQDWFLALFWIVNITLLFSHFEYMWHEDKTEYIVLFISSIFIIWISVLKKFLLAGTFILYVISSFFREDFNLKSFSNTINPFSMMNSDSMLMFSTLIYKIVIAYLVYQLIISIRQNTRRK